jgi:uncharacterized protein YndB with AHSA1/START domain
MKNQVQKHIELDASIERVWKALTNHEEFGTWFRVKLEGPFIPGHVARGHITYPGYEHLVWEVTVVKMEEPKYFSFTWHPYAVDPEVDYSKEAPTLVEFTLEPSGKRTRLTVTESGFDKLPKHRMPEAMRMNEGGWAEQMKNIKAHVDS